MLQIIVNTIGTAILSFDNTTPVARTGYSAVQYFSTF